MNPAIHLARRCCGAPLWVSGFRPFYLLGALYAPLLALGGVGAALGWVNLADSGIVLPLWHGHEMVFGFAMAIVVGTLLTALPSWAGTPELRGAPLLLLAGLWLIGRAAFWAAPWLPRGLPALADLLLLPALAALLAAPLWRVQQRRYRGLLPILAALALANARYHAAVIDGDGAGAALALRAAVLTLVVLYVLVGGLLTQVFTANALRAAGKQEPGAPLRPLEATALTALLLLAVCELADAPAHGTAAAALACALLHGARVLRWRGWQVARAPLLAGMHLGFAWLLLAFVLQALAAAGAGVPRVAWMHAFTVGALGLMMLALMTRVALRHTGRKLESPRWLAPACAAMFAAAALRLAAGVPAWGAVAVPLAALSVLLWAACFATFALAFAPALLAPSLPRG